jgi:hypothetical protein
LRGGEGLAAVQCQLGVAYGWLLSTVRVREREIRGELRPAILLVLVFVRILPQLREPLIFQVDANLKDTEENEQNKNAEPNEESDAKRTTIGRRRGQPREVYRALQWVGTRIKKEAGARRYTGPQIRLPDHNGRRPTAM